MNGPIDPVVGEGTPYRKVENLHILFWLLKDISWCLEWKVLGISMIFPTLLIAVVISWRQRYRPSELAHNVAVAFWITANSYWMISEFFGFDEVHIWQAVQARHLAAIPFALGMLFLLNYYLFGRKSRQVEPSAIP